MVQILRRPHLVLAYIGDIDGLGTGLIADLVNDLMGLELGFAVHGLVVVFLPAADLLHPELVLGLFDIGQNGLQDIACIAGQAQVYCDIFAKLARVDVDLDDFGTLGEGVGVQRHTVTEPCADGNNEVGLINGLVGGVAAVHTQQPQIVRLAVAQHTGGHKGVGGGHTGLFQQIAQGLAARRTAHAATEVDDGALRLVDHPGSGLDLLLIVAGHSADQLRCLGGELTAGGGDVLRNIDQHGAFAARLGNAEGGAHRIGQILNTADCVVVLGDRHRDALDVGLLKGVLAQQGRSHIAGEGDHRYAVHISGGDAGDKVCGARAAGGQHYTGAAGRAGVAVRSVGGTLLMCGQYMAYTVGIFIQFVIQIQHGTAGIAEQGVNALFDQYLNEDLRTGQFHDACSFLLPDTAFRGCVGRHTHMAPGMGQ